MNILVTNDDGYKSDGIRTLVKSLALFGDVYVCCPHKQQSASSMSISINKKIKIHLPENIVGAKRTVTIEGTPSDCISVALKEFKVDFNLCVSGINYGHNLANDIFYSGTIGAARQARLKEIHSIAVSAANPNAPYIYDALNSFFDYIFDTKLYKGDHILNVNFPSINFNKTNGFKLTKLGKKLHNSDFIYDEDKKVYITKYSSKKFIEDINSDVAAVEDGYISITPISFDNTDHSFLDKISKKNL